jgi:RNA polymerase sigma factor (sigma-70 family)
MPPPAEGFVTRFLVGPALRAQPDGRLVTLVRDGYDAAFEEIVRRYGGALRRYTAGIVGGRAEDVTQDAFSKALLALRRDGAEIDLRPWLFRIARNTALNDLRDNPRAPEQLAEELVHGGSGPAETVERREELAELIRRLRSLPDSQRAAIVMRELEGLSHDEIAAALGISGGAARQAIHRARTTLRDGFGLALPLPLLRLMLENSGAPAAEVAAGGVGAGVVLKTAAATVLVAGTLGAGLALHQGGRNGHAQAADGDPATAVDAKAADPAQGATIADGSQGTHGTEHDRRSGSRHPGSDDSERRRSGAETSHEGSGGDSHGGSRSSGHGSPSSGSGDNSRTGHTGSSSPSGSNSGPGGGGASGPDDGSESNSGPDSGGGDDSSSLESESSRDSGDGEGFSSQTQSLTEEDR